MSTSRPWPGIELPNSRPADWGVGMTVCIAAMADNGKQIVTVSDHKLSMQDYSADNLACKDVPIHHNWYALTANDVSYTPFLLDSVTSELVKKRGWSVHEVAHIFRVQRSALEEAEINSSILGKHGYTRDTFNAKGKDELRSSTYNSLRRKIEAFSLRNDFLVYGFGPDVSGHIDGHIFTSDASGEIRSCDSLGFWAIGSGTHMLLAPFSSTLKGLGSTRTHHWVR
jgi:hypothetical protein